MKILRVLRTKPWEVEEERPELMPPSGLATLPSHKIGLRFFLAVASSFFMLFVVSYLFRMDYPDWRPSPEPWQLWLNTLFLLCGSIALQMARSAADNEIVRVRRGVHLGGFFTVAFLLGQLWAWWVMIQSGYLLKLNPANSFFYLITAVHGLHILGGLVAWFRTARKIWRGAQVADVRLSVELCTTYWHFLLLVWLFIFYMLLVT